MKIFKEIKVYNFSFKNEEQSIFLLKGTYIFECWGAAGGQSPHELTEHGCDTTKGKGGYTKGYIKLTEDRTFYIYVGEKGLTGSKEIFNSNNNSLVDGGGGATDIRIVGGEWFLFDSLKSRIMVAGGGGNGERYCGGDGGGINGTINSYNISNAFFTTQGTQISGGKKGEYWDDNKAYYGHGSDGRFGFSGDGYCTGKDSNVICDLGAAGGSGYYGGGGTPLKGSGGGGSSFISGHPGCNAIDITSTEFNIQHTNQPNHYSNLIFFKSETIAGNQYMYSPDNEYVIGNDSNGFARITELKEVTVTCEQNNENHLLLILILLL